MTRAEALKLAEDLVSRVAPTTDPRGRGSSDSIKLGERVSAILRVADFLVPEEKGSAE